MTEFNRTVALADICCSCMCCPICEDASVEFTMRFMSEDVTTVISGANLSARVASLSTSNVSQFSPRPPEKI